MPIEYYAGANHPTFNVQNPDDLYEALDILHTQVLDGFGDKDMAPYLDVLEKAMNRVDDLREVKP